MLAPAKINLDLRITGRREDGYHLLDSIVCFADFGDVITAEKNDCLALEVSGPFASELKNSEGNLILKAINALCDEVGVEPLLKFHLVKNLPVSSGIGGGSADAAAALKLTRQMLVLDVDDEKMYEVALRIGADVPICLFSKTAHMFGIGDQIKEIKLDRELSMLLVNPHVSISTQDIFKQFTLSKIPFEQKRHFCQEEVHLPLMMSVLKDSKNSLQSSACIKETAIVEVLDGLEKTDGLLLSRMSGSGATCFALYETMQACKNAADKIKTLNENWWIKETKIR